MIKKMSTERRIKFIRSFSPFIIECYRRDIILVPYEFHRTMNRQQELYALGRTKPGRIVTYKDGIIEISNHQIWEAADCCLVFINPLTGGYRWEWSRDPKYDEAGDLCREFGLRWGGDWDSDDEIDSTDFDIYHFELARTQ